MARNNYNEVVDTPFKMDRRNGCTLYCLANLINSEEPLKKVDEYQYTSPSNESKVFAEFGLDLYQYGLIHQSIGSLPEEFLVQAIDFVLGEVKRDFNTGYLAFLARVIVAEGAVHNVLLFVNLSNGTYLTSDPDKPKVIYHTTLTSFMKYTGTLLGLSIVTTEHTEGIKIFKEEDLKHLLGNG